ncbi:hypothetical protein BOTBODRAFT_180539 [Botryobasidium botryosum FD-172 SS1]|uniref:Uncharacterized protein n=1 Tax=Botryobasidium botryosum (strain FD-172 SS1) TaxID=930990 RepID=A0A067LZ64_BOTB1|nr:hypothetical protein BOTBODRAFT_180539 [Botryobasidium botryosum FD-172 SS1]
MADPGTIVAGVCLACILPTLQYFSWKHDFGARGFGGQQSTWCRFDCGWERKAAHEVDVALHEWGRTGKRVVKQQYERAIPMVQLVAKRGPRATPAQPDPNLKENIGSRSEIDHGDEEFDEEDLHLGRPVSPRRSNDYASRGLDPGPSSFSPTSLTFPPSLQTRVAERGAMSGYDSDDTLAGTFESGRPMR